MLKKNIDNIKKLGKELLEEESIELDLIKLYRTLLDNGVENCVEEKNRKYLKEGMSVLYEDSLWHKEIIESIFKKYL